jgi:hypothetical protein
MPVQNLHTLPIRDFIIPLGCIKDNGAFSLEGTGCLIGSQGLVLTAAHVADALGRNGNATALFVGDGNWTAVQITDLENHPSEDVAVVKLEGDEWYSIHKVSQANEHASQDVMMWGYPEKIAEEIRQASSDPFLKDYGVRPDLVYMKGYIRRRISREMPVGIIIGSAFYEISEAAGSCYSGAPVCPQQAGRTFEIIGTYVGEETAGRHHVGITVRSDAFSEWEPAISGLPLHAEKPTHG